MIIKLAEIIKYLKPLWLPLNLALVLGLGFGLGRLTKLEEARPPITIENVAVEAAAAIPAQAGQFVASKNGTKYHLPWCSGADRIKEENKIWFNSKESAERAGYGPAANCPGL